MPRRSPHVETKFKRGLTPTTRIFILPFEYRCFSVDFLSVGSHQYVRYATEEQSTSSNKVFELPAALCKVFLRRYVW